MINLSRTLSRMSRRRDPSIRRVRVRRSRRRSHAALLRRFRDPRGAARRGCFAGARSAGPAWWGQWFRKRKSASPKSTRGYVGVQLCQLNFYLDAPKALLERFRSISLVRFVASSKPPSKLCRVEERVAKGAFPTVSLEPSDSLLDLLATFRACNFQW